MNLDNDFAAQRNKAEELVQRYRARLADIAELGQAIARSEAKFSRLQAQHDYFVLRHHILNTLAPVMHKLHQDLARPVYSKARRRADSKVTEDRALVGSSGLLDAEWYLELYPDVAKENIDPLEHYVLYGAYELRDPGPRFSAFKYHKANPDVTDAGCPALLHYLQHGRDEGRPAFNVGEEP